MAVASEVDLAAPGGAESLYYRKEKSDWQVKDGAKRKRTAVRIAFFMGSGYTKE